MKEASSIGHHARSMASCPIMRTRFAVLQYKHSRIYWGGDRKYRVLTENKKATTNFSWRDEADAADCWYDVIARCDEHACMNDALG